MKILLFVSSHCPHCPKAEAVTKRVVPEYEVEFEKIRVKTAEGKQLSTRFNVMSLATILILDNEGKEVQRIVGIPSGDSLKNDIEKGLGIKKSLFGKIFGR